MKMTTKLRLLGGAILLFNLWLIGHYNLSGVTVLLVTFGFAVAYEFLVVRPARRSPLGESVEDKRLSTSQQAAFVPDKTGPAMPTNQPSNDTAEDQHWAKGLAELEGGGRQAGLWARCFAEAQGNEALARANYLSARARNLADEYRAQVVKVKQAEEQAKRDAEAARLAEEQRRYDALPRGRCPSCDEVILLSAQKCPKCRALFTPGSAWKVGPV